MDHMIIVIIIRCQFGNLTKKREILFYPFLVFRLIPKKQKTIAFLLYQKKNQEL